VRISAQLVNGTTDEHLWAKPTIESNVLLQRKLPAHRRADRFAVNATTAAATSFGRASRQPRAYQAYLLGRYY
jgi:hypothetical protein